MIKPYNYKGLSHSETLNTILAVNDVIKNGMGAEIGVSWGVNASYILRMNPNLFLYLVDPYEPYEDWNAPVTKEMQDSAKKGALEVVRDYKVKWLYTSSAKASTAVLDKSLDFVFIDAKHTYENCSEDIALWVPKIRGGGLLSGHDYGMPGIKKAVTEFCASTKRQVVVPNNDSAVWAVELN